MTDTTSVLYAVLVASGLTGAAVTQIVPHMPRETLADYFTVESISAERAGSQVVMQVDRHIIKPLLMSYAVRVFQITDAGAVPVCIAHGGPFRYRPDAVLPDPLTLKWWTDGACGKIPDGRVQIETTWDAVEPDFAPISITVEVEE